MTPPYVEKAITFLALDCQKTHSTFVNTIFSGKDLNERAGLELSQPQVIELMRHLETQCYVVRTDKQGTDGDYFNIAPHVYLILHKTRFDARFVRNLKTPETGFCIFKTKNRTFRQPCEGRKCPYYLASEKHCVLGKFFIK